MYLRNCIKTFSDERWNIGFIQNNIDSIICGEQLQLKWLKHDCRKSWFADPFILDVLEDEIHLLVEEFYKPIKRGRISRLIIDKKTYELKCKDVVLELDTHLSFPAIIRKKEGVFIYPENGESGKLNLYQYFPETNKCIKKGVLLDEAVADAVIATIYDKEILFCTKQPCPNGNALFMYCKDKFDNFVEKEKYVFDENVARMAGDVFVHNGVLYRPTQECNVQYGHAVTLQKVTQQDGKFLFKEIRRMGPVHPKLNVGMHTFNMYKGVIVTDALGFDNMWIRNILRALRLI